MVEKKGFQGEEKPAIKGGTALFSYEVKMKSK